MLKGLKKFVCLVMVLAVSAVISVPTFAESVSPVNNNAHEVILSKPGDVIVKDNGKSMDEILKEAKEEKPSINDKTNPATSMFLVDHRYSICNISRPSQFNLFDPLSEFVENRYYKSSSDWPSVTVSRGTSTTVGVSVNTSVGVNADVVSAGLGMTVSGSTTLSTSQAYSYKVGYGQRGRVIMRYSRNYYTFTCKDETLLLGNVIHTDTGSGDAMTKPYNNYVAYQYYQIW